MSNPGDQHTRPAHRPSARLNDDLHVAPKEHGKPHEPVEREPGRPTPNQGRNLG